MGASRFNGRQSKAQANKSLGTAVSGSFLFLIGLANSIILWKVLAKRRRVWLPLFPGTLKTDSHVQMKNERARRIARGEDVTHYDQEIAEEEGKGSSFMMRIIGPIVTFVNTPWKMYPVGVLFGFGEYYNPKYHIAILTSRLGFDTASSIALLAVSAIAKKDSNGRQIHSANIVILPVSSRMWGSLTECLTSCSSYSRQA